MFLGPFSVGRTCSHYLCGVFARVGVYGYVLHCVVIVVVVVLVVVSVLALMLWLLCGEKKKRDLTSMTGSKTISVVVHKSPRRGIYSHHGFDKCKANFCK